METTFHNVLITVSAATPKEAYNKLCLLLRDKDVEYTTDTYSTNPPGFGEEGATNVLMGGGDDMGTGDDSMPDLDVQSAIEARADGPLLNGNGRK